METLQINQKEMLEIKTCSRNEEWFWWTIISTLNTTQERISEIKYQMKETSHIETQRDKRVKTPQNIHELWDNIKITYT